MQEFLIIEEIEKINDQELFYKYLFMVKEAQKANLNMEMKNFEMRDNFDKYKIDMTSNQ